MADPQPSPLSAEEKAARAASFGGAAVHYERYRQGPPLEAAEWILPTGARTVVDLGAGTGALSRLLIGRVDKVIAVEPDARMRSVLTEMVPDVRAVEGRGGVDATSGRLRRRGDRIVVVALGRSRAGPARGWTCACARRRPGGDRVRHRSRRRVHRRGTGDVAWQRGRREQQRIVSGRAEPCRALCCGERSGRDDPGARDPTRGSVRSARADSVDVECRAERRRTYRAARHLQLGPSHGG